MAGISRKGRRKEARLEKKSRKFQSFIQHQKARKLERTSLDLASKKVKSSIDSDTQISGQGNVLQTNDILKKDDNNHLLQPDLAKRLEDKLDSSEYHDSTVSKMRKKKDLERKKKTKFEEYLEMSSAQKAFISADEDLKLERKLAKKLKVKEGKLRGADDELNMLFEGVSSALDFLEYDEISSSKEFSVESPKTSSSIKKGKKRKSSIPEDEVVGGIEFGTSDPVETCGSEVVPEDVAAKPRSCKKPRKRKSTDQGIEGQLAIKVSEAGETCDTEVILEEVPAKGPVLEGFVKYVAPHMRDRAGNGLEDYSQLRRRVRGLLNRLSESNVESITGEMSTIFRSVPRSVASQMFSDEVLASCSGGPRGNEQYAAVFAAFVAGMACSVGIDFSAKLIASLAKSFEDEYLKRDNLSLRNLTLLLSYLCIFEVCSSDLIYDFLIMLSKRLAEVDVSTILTILQCCGMKLRSDDPAAMKNFILSVQNRVNDLKASSGDGQSKIDNKRMEFMLETICDIKNNKKRVKEDPAHHTRIKKWLQKLKVEDTLIRGLTWSKLLNPDKKGQWWLTEAMPSTIDNVKEVASTIDREVLEAQKMLQLASAQRMNTEARKAIFCIIMSGEDYIDAFEKLLRLDLHGKQDREIMRVLVNCCLQEKVFNKYYAVLASKLCNHDKNHKFTLQYCLWDHFKEVESMQLIKSMHLAKFVAEMLSSFTLSLAVLKTVDFTDIVMLTVKRIMHFRMLFEAVFENSDALIWNIFTRVAVAPELEDLRNGIEFFVNKYVLSANKGAAKKFKVAKRALNNVEGVLM